jgi:hypothetical protein
MPHIHGEYGSIGVPGVTLPCEKEPIPLDDFRVVIDCLKFDKSIKPGLNFISRHIAGMCEPAAPQTENNY